MEIQIATTVKGISVPDLIRSIESPGLENGINFPERQENYLRRACSKDFNQEFPFRKYSVKRVSDMGYVTVYWNYKED